ncbi:hypothetical protein N752_20570 [Desulforamulus aquiferis]|nr:hypothetical protein [Desulforamulus aquiferis]RYD03229.1 hypothetical protein N752_20570 [Desulforamulus aquiferis]
MNNYQQPNWQEEMRIRVDINNMMEEFIGPEEGFSRRQIASLDSQIRLAHHNMREKRKKGGMDWRELPFNQDDLIEAINKLQKISVDVTKLL